MKVFIEIPLTTNDKGIVCCTVPKILKNNKIVPKYVFTDSRFCIKNNSYQVINNVKFNTKVIVISSFWIQYLIFFLQI